MKKRNIHIKGAAIAAFLLLSALQPVFPKVYWGLRTGIARSSIVQRVDLNYRSGWSVGGSIAGLMDIPFYERFSFRPEVALVHQGGSFLSGLDDSEDYQLLNEFSGYALQPSFNVAFNIPISGVKMAVYAGPALDFHLDGKLAEKPLTEGTNPLGQQVKSFDLAVNSGISVEYKGFFFSITSLSGTFDRRKQKVESDPPVYQNNVTFSLGYFFR